MARDLLDLFLKDAYTVPARYWFENENKDEYPTIFFNDQTVQAFLLKKEIGQAVIKSGDKLDLFLECQECGHTNPAEEWHKYLTKDCTGCQEQLAIVKEAHDDLAARKAEYGLK